MLVRTKIRRIKHTTSTVKKEQARLIPWKDAFKKEIEKYTEAGLSLRGSRLKEGLTQKNLGEALGISQNHISEMENGKRTIGKDMAKRFAAFFKTDYRIFL